MPLKYDRQIDDSNNLRILKMPSSKAAASEEARRTLRYVEPLSDARTPLADFFSILLGDGSFLGKRFQCRRYIFEGMGKFVELWSPCHHLGRDRRELTVVDRDF
ncbi:MAG: hypothetical protein JW395_1429 [Nitrospira sp.]|nr:hypothetical protein [Nitrospira sp.]